MLSEDKLIALIAIHREVKMEEPFESLKEELVKDGYAERIQTYILTEKGEQTFQHLMDEEETERQNNIKERLTKS